MADIKQIQFKRSNEPGKKPTASQLAEGELAINLRDRTLFTKDDQGLIVDLGFAKGGTVTGDINQTGNLTVNGNGYIKNLTFDNIIPVKNGGTGTSDTNGQGAVNISAMPSRFRPPSEITDVNQLGVSSSDRKWLGIWMFDNLSNYELPNCPIRAPGVLEVFNSSAYGCSQKYTTRYGQIFFRTVTTGWTAAKPDVWAVWIDVSTSMNPYFQDGDLNLLTTPGRYAVTNTASNIPFPSTGILEIQHRAPSPVTGFSSILQTYSTFNISSTTGNRQWRRTMDGAGTWSSWVETVTENTAKALVFDKYIKPYGLGTGLTGDDIPAIANFDDQTPTGFYKYSTSTPGNPLPTASGVVINTRYSTVYCSQIAISVQLEYTDRYNRIFSRTQNNGKWGDWKEVFTTGSDIPLSNMSELAALGIGQGIIPVQATLDMQQFDFKSNAIYRVAFGNIANGPSELNYLSGTGVYIAVDGAVEGRYSLRVTPDTASDSIYNLYNILVTGNKGSRVFKVRQIWNTANIIPVNKGGTGANNADAARANLVAAKSGANSDITSLASLAGPLKIGDPLSALDAATKRYVDNAIAQGGTGGGATMNGIMNNSVGTPGMAASRAFIQPYDVPQDGQLLNRADYPELWAFAQRLTPITDAAWLGDARKRGSYSLGNGTTTFRVPDWNGVQVNSIPGVFFRGGAGTDDMALAWNAAPNITGDFRVAPYNNLVDLQNANDSHGSFSSSTVIGEAILGSNGAYPRTTVIKLNASLSASAYGRNNTNEVVPNKVSGVWVVRAKGSFQSASTKWQVINGEASVPANGATVIGGDVISLSQIAGKDYVSSTMRAYSVVGAKSFSEIYLVDSRDPANIRDVHFTFDIDGGMVVPGTVDANDVFIRSDINSKTDIKKFDSPEETLSKMDGYLYLLKDGTNGASSQKWKKSAGLIAQEVQAVLPELVNEDSDTGLLRLNYNGIIALNTSAINKHTKRINELEEIVKELQAKLK